MKLTQDKLKRYKKNYEVTRLYYKKDRYLKEEVKEIIGTIEAMISPLQDQVSIEQYGQDIEDMRQFVYYGDLKLKHKDTLSVDGVDYEIISILPYNEFKHVKIKKVGHE